MQNDSPVSVQTLALPKGGGAIVGLGENLGPIGPTGMAALALPLPVSAGRGYAPSLTLNYSSGAGNSPFGLGWHLALTTIQRRTNRGVPRYDGGVEDEFVGPDGEVLVSERGADGKTITTSVNQYGGQDLGATYRVTRYFPRVEGPFHRIERWQGASATDDFWLIHGADGQLHCLGKTPGGRVADPDRPERIGEWRVEESVNPLGEHIYYRYVAENADNVTADNEKSRAQTANRYLAEVYYGNRAAAAGLYLWGMADASTQGWLFSVVLDYGERGVDLATPPPYATPPDGKWPLRADSFSRYAYGFEVRTHRLCRQVLMFHHFPDELGQDHTLVRRLLFIHRESPVVTHLVQARTLAYEKDGTLQSLPPLELGYSTFEPQPFAADYQVFDGVPELNDATHYEMVDLYGDGVPGVLFRHGAGWRYRAPIRGKAGPDDIAYDQWRLMPEVPSMQPARIALADIDGDGRLDWVIARPGMAGAFSFREGNAWSGFTPFNAFPPEFLHPQAQMVDLVGAGLADIALIGPSSVRLYGNRRDGYAAGTDVSHAADGDDIGLPIAGRDERELVAFSDILGSGQPHLVRIRCDGVTCWPNLGRGVFGKPFLLASLDFDPETFNPDQVFLADLDGSGAADLVYIEQTRLTFCLNQSGNGLAAPVVMPLPAGLTYDRLCRVSFADLQGLGVASMVISHRHMDPRHWRLDFTRAKPYLMTSINNNMGAATTLRYRSSVQYWLDDKQANPGLASALPMPVHTLEQVATRDEITGNARTQLYGFHHGVYDGVEREFRGFGFVTTQDTQQVANAVEPDVPIAPPLLTRSWYHSGREADEALPYGPTYRDPDAFAVKATRLTRYDANTAQDVELDGVDAATRYWLFRALKGMPLRQESYGLDGNASQDVPYSVSTWRHQVRLVQGAATDAPPVALPGPLEQVHYLYERIAVDPLVAQQAVLGRDAYGAVAWQVAVNYPRRPKPDTNPYPDTLPATSWASSYDDQQASLILTESRARAMHLDNAQAWRLDLPWQERGDVLVYDGGQAPAEGLCFETLTRQGGLLDASRPRVYAGQRVMVYADQPVKLNALVDHVESAEFDDVCLKAYDGVLEGDARDTMLKQAGYVLADRVLPPVSGTEPQVWVAPRGYSTYRDASGFYRPASQRASQLTGAVEYEYDAYACGLSRTTDALGNQTTATYDYRFLLPVEVVDLNANTHEVLLDALGRVLATSFYGSEEGQNVGFLPVATLGSSIEPPWKQTIAQAIGAAGTARQEVAGIQLEDAFSWMGGLSEDDLHGMTDDVAGLWSALQACGFITADGRILSAARTWADGTVAQPGIPEALRSVIQAIDRMPVQSLALAADRYPADPAQQVRVGLAYFDGMGQTLQSVAKMPPGPAWQRDAHGEIVVGPDGRPVTADATTRWAVSGKVEYDNKGQAVRRYQPYYLNDWRYVADTAMRTCGYADTHFYDATGREAKVITAKGYLRRNAYFPWFTVAEDENDTFAPPSPSPSPPPPPPDGRTTVTLTLDRLDRAPADGVTGIEVTATVMVGDSAPVPDGTVVTFSATNGATVQPAVTTAVQGKAGVQVTSKTVGDSQLAATANGVTSGPLTLHFTATSPSVVAVAGVVVKLDRLFATADGDDNVPGKVSVTMSDGNPAPDGTPVTLSASNYAVVTPSSGTTRDGELQLQVSSETAGICDVTATAGAVTSDPAKVFFNDG